MKKGDKVYINSKYHKSNIRLNGWSEANLYGTEILKAGTILYHVSEYNKLQGFSDITTCFNVEKPGLTGYVYIFILEKDMEFEHIDKYEYRRDLSENDNDNFDIYYAGTLKYNKTSWVVADKNNNIVGFQKKINFAEQFESIKNKLESKYETAIDEEHLDSYSVRIYGTHKVKYSELND